MWMLIEVSKPVRGSPRQIQFALTEPVKKEVSKMLELGVIEHSESPYSSPIVIMTKEDNNFCFLDRF